MTLRLTCYRCHKMGKGIDFRCIETVNRVRKYSPICKECEGPRIWPPYTGNAPTDPAALRRYKDAARKRREYEAKKLRESAPKIEAPVESRKPTSVFDWKR